MVLPFSDRLDVEIGRVNAASRRMIDAYTQWGSLIQIGDMQQFMYNELIDFVNFRMETAQTCLLLVEAERVADALGLCRSLLENYLLHMLRCRGRKFFRISERTDLTDSEFKAHLRAEQEKNEELRAQGKRAWLEVKKVPRASKRVMYVQEGLANPDEPDFFVSPHYFQFQSFQPEAMRLNTDDYFTYLPSTGAAKKAVDAVRTEVTHLYRYYLSYDALVQCLELNELADTAVIRRIEAHYTFLGKFLHPTHNAARDLRENSNWHSGGHTVVGMDRPYAKPAGLLAALYVCHLVAGLLDETALLHENAPKRYIRNAGTTQLREATARPAADFPYFWFLYNKPPLWDKYNYAAHHVNAERLNELGSYRNIPDDEIPFDQNIYNHLQQALNGWHNAACGHYPSPLA